MMRILGTSRNRTDLGKAPERENDRPTVSRPVPSIDLEVPEVIETATFALG